MPDAVTAALPIRTLFWSLLGAVVGLWLGYAIVAGVKQGSAASQPAARARSAPVTTPVDLGLSVAPALRVRSGLLAPTPVTRVVRHPSRARTRHRAHAASIPRPVTQPVMTAPTTPAATPAPAAPVQPTPTPTPAPAPQRAPKPQPTLTPAPKPSSSPSFDQSAPSGFDTSG